MYLYNIVHRLAWKVIMLTQWRLKSQIDVNCWPLSSHNVNLILISCCQIANITWTSTHAINIMSRMYLENNHWQQNMKKHFGWNILSDFFKCQCVTSIWCQQLMSIWCRELRSQTLSFLNYCWWSVDANC